MLRYQRLIIMAATALLYGGLRQYCTGKNLFNGTAKLQAPILSSGSHFWIRPKRIMSNGLPSWRTCLAKRAACFLSATASPKGWRNMLYSQGWSR